MTVIAVILVTDVFYVYFILEEHKQICVFN